MDACSKEAGEFETGLEVFGANVENRIGEKTKEFEETTGEKQKEFDDAFAEFKFEVKWEPTSILIPEFKVGFVDRKLSLSIPEVTMKDRRIVFETPSVRMERKKIGQKPETICEPTWIKTKIPFNGTVKTKGPPKCTVKWTDIFADVPVPYMEKHEVVFKVPEFTMGKQEIVLKLPEFKISQREAKLHLPQFKLIEAYINQEDEKRRAAQAQEEFAHLSAEMQSEIELIREEEKQKVVPKVSAYFDCLRGSLNSSKQSAISSFDAAINQIQSAIVAMEAQGASETPEISELRRQLSETKQHKIEVNEQFETQLEELFDTEKNVIESLGTDSA
ncbi:hypothetical protein [uncultured Ruegeria sp.]|uniref:hypothetical protein n=1 Tax=uncultured Ruegeria sp. TaxID=259304 RepID=UPI002622B614|nr:hypothetical protein [uncultured Ruegeria sp.]